MDPAGERRRITARRTLHRGAKFDLELVEFSDPSGQPVRREFVRHPGSVVILPLLARPGHPPDIILIRQDRPAIGKAIFELPAGTLEPPEAPAACGTRELIEETGYRAATLTPLARFYTSPGLGDELMEAFAATGLTHVGQNLQADEELTVVPMPAAEALRLIDRGELVDAKSILTLLLGQRRGLY